jgi:UDP-2,3-diacylglucosamine pyrophosphatase LpxH
LDRETDHGPLPDFLSRWIQRRIQTVLDGARELLFDDDSRLVFFSDCHRGNRGRDDAFAVNEMLFLAALTYYDRRGFTYVEVGDGDELWQNVNFRDILSSHWPTFDMLHRFNLQGRLHLILGNHDIPHRSRIPGDKDGIGIRESLLLRHRRTNQRLLVLHGHQADVKSDALSTVSRALVRYVWRHLQHWGSVQRWLDVVRRRSTHPNLFARIIERRLSRWAGAQGQAVICGHTHRAVLSDYGDPPYFNTGSWTVPGVATGLEIQGGEISLVRWIAHPVTQAFRREVLAEPRKLKLFAV